MITNLLNRCFVKIFMYYLSHSITASYVLPFYLPLALLRCKILLDRRNPSTGSLRSLNYETVIIIHKAISREGWGLGCYPTHKYCSPPLEHGNGAFIGFFCLAKHVFSACFLIGLYLLPVFTERITVQ